MPSSRSANAADARPPPRPFGLRSAGPPAALLAPYMQPGMLVARVLPAGLGTSSKMHMLFMRRSLVLDGLSVDHLASGGDGDLFLLSALFNYHFEIRLAVFQDLFR